MTVFVPQRKRSARGELRVASLLDAAARVFGKAGYHQATTNAIAAEAQVSPATLYQFFPNLEAIADALATRYSIELTKEQTPENAEAWEKLSLAGIIEVILKPVLQFHRKNPAFRTLLTEAPLSKSTLHHKHLLSQAFTGRLAEALVAKSPRIPRKEAEWNANVCLTVLKGFLLLVVTAPGASRDKSLRALKDVLVRFLEPLVS